MGDFCCECCERFILEPADVFSVFQRMVFQRTTRRSQSFLDGTKQTVRKLFYSPFLLPGFKASYFFGGPRILKPFCQRTSTCSHLRIAIFFVLDWTGIVGFRFRGELERFFWRNQRMFFRSNFVPVNPHFLQTKFRLVKYESVWRMIWWVWFTSMFVDVIDLVTDPEKKIGRFPINQKHLFSKLHPTAAGSPPLRTAAWWHDVLCFAP